MKFVCWSACFLYTFLITWIPAFGEEQVPGQRRGAFAEMGGMYDAMRNLCTSNDSASTLCVEEPLYVGAWNLERFGVAKMDEGHVVQVIVEVMALYDLMVMQEVTDSSGTSVPALVAALNEYMGGGQVYLAVESPRIGRTSYKEQYVFVYKQSRMTFIQAYKYADDTDVFQVEPFIAHFSLNTTGNLTEFAVIPLHAKPDDAPVELDAMVDVYDDMVTQLGLEDAIILGDFNAGCSYVTQTEFDQIRFHNDARFHWLISDHEDTTTKTTSCPYDRIVLAGSTTQSSAYYKTASAYYFDEAFGFESNQTLLEDVSDHYPVGVMLRGSVPPSVESMFTWDTASSSADEQEVRVSISADLPAQESWDPVLAIINETCANCSSNSSACAPPDVAVVSSIVYAEWYADDVDGALSLVIALSEHHSDVVPMEAVAVLGYKTGHRALIDPSMYAVESEPREVVVTLICLPDSQGARCRLGLSARTGIN